MPIVAVLTALLLLCGFRGQSQTSAQTSIAVPAYFDNESDWARLSASAPKVGIVIVNPDSGPGQAPRTTLQTETSHAQKHGIRVIGYVYTDYGKRPISQVEQDIDRYIAWYKVDGIFFDQAASSDQAIPYYRQCYAYAKDRHSPLLVVINPGTQTTESYMSVCDIECNFEGDMAAYTSSYQSPGWTEKYNPRRFWHVIYRVKTLADIGKTVRMSRIRHAGWIYITPLDLPNPYAALPENDFWQTEITAASKLD